MTDGVKECLRRQLLAASSRSYAELVKEKKDRALKDLVSRRPAHFYEQQVFNGTIDDVEGIEILLEAVETPEQKDVFDYFRNTVSSVPQCANTGRTLSVLVRDGASSKYLGLIQLTQCVMHPSSYLPELDRETASKTQIKHIRDNSVNLSICVPLQPFGFNYCGGKLLAMLAFSKEVHNLWTLKFKTRLACVHTTSIHGKSVQYDRLKELKFVGFTRGVGTVHIPKRLIDECRLYLMDCCPPPQRILQRWTVPELSHQNIVQLAAERLGLDEGVLEHGQRRGIYVGWTGSNAKAFLLQGSKVFEQDALADASGLGSFWCARWARQRSQHLAGKQQEPKDSRSTPQTSTLIKFNPATFKFAALG